MLAAAVEAGGGAGDGVDNGAGGMSGGPEETAGAVEVGRESEFGAPGFFSVAVGRNQPVKRLKRFIAQILSQNVLRVRPLPRFA